MTEPSKPHEHDQGNHDQANHEPGNGVRPAEEIASGEPGKSDKSDKFGEAGSSSAPEFGAPFDYDATADASLTESTSGTSAVPPSGGSTAGPGWDTYSGVGNGPGWGTGPSYPPPASDPLPPVSGGPVYGTPQPEYGQPEYGTYGSSDYGQAGQSSYPGYPSAPGYPSGPGYGAAPGYPSAGFPAGYGGYGDPAAPFGRDPMIGEPYSDKTKTVAGLLQIIPSFFGFCGVGRLYLGHTVIGLIQLLGMFLSMLLSLLLIGIPFMIGIWIWAFVEGIMMLTGSIRDAQGRPLRS